jgi:hypothetical protein
MPPSPPPAARRSRRSSTARSAPFMQGLTLVHFSAKPKHLLWATCVHFSLRREHFLWAMLGGFNDKHVSGSAERWTLGLALVTKNG